VLITSHNLATILLAALPVLAVASPAFGQPVQLPGTWNVKIVDSPDEAGAPEVCDSVRYKFEATGQGLYSAKCVDMAHDEKFRVKTPVRWEWRSSSLALQFNNQPFETCAALPTRPAEKAEAITRGCRYFVEGPDTILLWKEEAGPVRRQLLRLERGKSEHPLKRDRAKRKHTAN